MGINEVKLVDLHWNQAHKLQGGLLMKWYFIDHICWYSKTLKNLFLSNSHVEVYFHVLDNFTKNYTHHYMLSFRRGGILISKNIEVKTQSYHEDKPKAHAWSKFTPHMPLLCKMWSCNIHYWALRPQKHKMKPLPLSTIPYHKPNGKEASRHWMSPKKGPPQTTMSTIDPRNALLKNNFAFSMWMGWHVTKPKNSLAILMKDQRKWISLSGSHSCGIRRIKSTMLTNLFMACRLIKLTSVLTAPSRSFTPNNNPLMGIGNEPS